MLGYLIRRIAAMLPVLFGVTFLIFALVYAMPGDPIAALAGDRPLPPSTVEALRERYHLDEPLITQYLLYMGGLLQGDFGTDFFDRPVLDMIAERWPTTLQLALTAWVLKLVIGLAVGIFGALHRGRAGDHLALAFTVLFVALPGFVIAFMAQLAFGLKLEWFPIAGIAEGWPMSFVLPALVVALEAAAPLARLTRSSLVDTLGSEFIRTARAKGASPGRVVWGHALRNSMIPVVTYLGLSLAAMLGGAVIVESVFNLPGIGGLLVQAVQTQQGTIVVGVATFIILIYLLVNLLVDISYGIIDPRVRNG
ncbi:peptide/nickel transport system permease protein [Saccharopolyspora kobensis]|uniref:Peptide/nickel transport system permease protein n=1 Tax=Saccharopolyspora kobensis TaxID=146035 RepID=A0A1H6A3B0_9PSEU|nr:ABC transporter permease [Saccharopolyspora kobensis]SEG42714.1 peptide/nickel transport system permease protein [Saccharopolyspora kobensis]SFE18331.1 peptide/nickel transport system permease protein/oligopeptide transport system permease protein [Saccharopolyspora kobensis]